MKEVGPIFTDGHTYERVMEDIVLLLNHGAKINATDKWGETPLDYAIRSGSKGVVNILVAKGGKTGKQVGL